MKYPKSRWIIIGAAIIFLVGTGFVWRFLPIKNTEPPAAKTAINNPAWPDNIAPSAAVNVTMSESEPVTVKIGSATLFGSINSLYKDGKKTEAAVRLAEWVKGQDDQEQAALVDGQCTLQQIESHACLNNPFYLRKTDKTIIIQVADKADIETYAREPRGGMLISPKTGNTYMEKISLEKFVEWYGQQTYLKETPYYFTTQNGVIMAIKEQYVP
jgi:hypothetical protein